MEIEPEKTIPVLTVTKNNAILKNIFLVLNTSSSSSLKEDETLTVGRNPSCDIVLSHPSVSLFHLHLLLSCHRDAFLSLLDLASVHGTWVNGEKVEPNVRVELKEGDIIQIGGSSRVYKLHWVPLSRTYDNNSSFVSPSYKLSEDKDLEEMLEDEKIIVCQHLDEDNSEGSDHEVSDENSRLLLSSEKPLEPLLSEKGAENTSTSHDELDGDIIPNSYPDLLATESETSSWLNEILSETEVEQFSPDKKKSVKLVDSESKQNLEFFESPSSLRSHEYSETPCLDSFILFSEFDIQQLDREKESLDENIGTLENKNILMENHEKISSPIIFSEKCETKAEISSLTSEIPLKTEKLCLELDIRQLDKENLNQKRNSATPPENKNTSAIDHRKRSSLSIFSENLESEAKISSLSDGISLKSENIFSEFYVQQLDRENESQEVNIVTPLRNNKTSIKDHEKTQSIIPIDHSKRSSLSIFSENIESEADISSLPYGISLKSENILSEFDVQQLDKENESQEVNIDTPLKNNNTLIRGHEKTESILPIGSEQNAVLHESLVALFPHDPFDQSSSLNFRISTEVNNQEVNQKIETQKENMVTPPLNDSEKKSSSSEIWSRRCKLSSDLRIQIRRSGDKRKMTDNIENLAVTQSPLTGLDSGEELYTPDKENFTPITLEKLKPNSSSSLKVKEKISANLFADWYEYNKQFTPNKVNNTPNTPLMRSMLKMSEMKRTSGSNLCKSSSLENMFVPSIEKNSAQKRQKLTTSCSRSHKIPTLKSGLNSSAKRVPFQSLFESSSFGSAEKDCKIKKYNGVLEVREKVKEYKRRWHMVVDATCLLNKESRKALELLRGFKGTQITIPRFVIRELERLNRQCSVFRSKTEAFYALKWIEECTANTDWWIHIQSSEEEPLSIVQTPPTTTKTRFSEMHRRFFDRVASSVLSLWESLFDIISPTATAEDHVLECAIEIRRNTRDAHIVLLSNDVTLMIKAMGGGLRCETAEEFRGSLVNPFSDRFLWSDSSSRGLTWSCADDHILKEKFYGHHTKIERGEALKGLKILLAIAT